MHTRGWSAEGCTARSCSPPSRRRHRPDRTAKAADSHARPETSPNRGACRRAVSEAVEEVGQACEVRGLVVVHRQVAALGAAEVAAFREAPCHRLHVGRVHRVVAGADPERRDIDPSEVGESRPLGELRFPADAELAGTLHRDVDRLVDVREATLYGIGPVLEPHPQHVLDVVVLHQQLREAWALGISGRFEGLDLLHCVLVHGRLEDLGGVVVVGGDVAHHFSDLETLPAVPYHERVYHTSASTYTYTL